MHSASLRALSERLRITLAYENLGAPRQKMIADHPSFGQVDYVATGAPLDLSTVGAGGDIGPEPLRSPVEDFYMTNPIARASVTMAECSAARVRPPVLMAAE